VPVTTVGTIIIDNSDLLRAVARSRGRINDLAPSFRVVGAMLVAAIDEEFDTAGHGRWPPLAASTLAKRRQKGRGAEPLKDKGLMAADISAESDAMSASAGTGKKYARFHVSDEPRSVIPLRNFLDVPDRVFDEAEDVLMRGILGEPLGG
jgi:phage gpG-like protein